MSLSSSAEAGPMARLPPTATSAGISILDPLSARVAEPGLRMDGFFTFGHSVVSASASYKAILCVAVAQSLTGGSNSAV